MAEPQPQASLETEGHAANPPAAVTQLARRAATAESPAPGTGPRSEGSSEAGLGGGSAPGSAISPARGPAPGSAGSFASFLHVPVQVQVDVPVVALTVGDLFRLDKGSILNTSQLTGANVPLRVGGRLLAWGEFQVVGDRLAVRVAELA